MQFIKTRDVKDPVRNVGENAGIDIYIPELNEDFINDLCAKNKSLYVVGCAATQEPLHLADVALANKLSYVSRVNGQIYIAPHKDIIIPSGISVFA